jgi:uncharacterized Zn finger protein
MTDALSPLKESDIEALATEQSWQRGKRYFRNGAIANPVRQGNQIWADCEGSVLYHTKATLGPQGVESTSCSCPYDWGGICKHEVALLLTYIHAPERFQAIKPLPELLAERSREDLLHMIEQMVQRHPDLLSVVDAPQSPALGQIVDLAKYRRQAERVFQGEEMHFMAAGLKALAEHGDRLGQSGDWLQAGDVYQLLLEVANEHYDHSVFEIDYDGEVACVIQDLAAGLQESLINAQELEAQRRRCWVETLLNAFLTDLEMGGIDYGYPAGETLINHTTAEDWLWLEPRIQAEIQQSQKSGFSDWGRQCLVSLLAARAEHQGDDQQAEKAILDFGTPEQKAFFHLEKRNFEAAIAIARSHFVTLPGLVTRFADGLLAAAAPHLAIEFVKDCAQHGSYNYHDWLTQFYRDYGQPEEFVEAQLALLKTRFSLEGYQTLQAKAESLGTWQTVRQSLLTDLEASENYTALIDIALFEQDWEVALYNLRQLSPWGKTHYQERVAAAIQVEQPGTAISLYQELIEAAIEQRGRSNYRLAAQYLQTIRPLYERLQRAEEFQQYVEQLRSQHKRLTALQQELDQAEL